MHLPLELANIICEYMEVLVFHNLDTKPPPKDLETHDIVISYEREPADDLEMSYRDHWIDVCVRKPVQERNKEAAALVKAILCWGQ